MTCRSEIPKVFHFPHDLRSMARNGYVCRNIEQYGDSMLPDALLDTLPAETVERLLTCITGQTISVFRRGSCWIAQR